MNGALLVTTLFEFVEYSSLFGNLAKRFDLLRVEGPLDTDKPFLQRGLRKFGQCGKW